MSCEQLDNHMADSDSVVVDVKSLESVHPLPSPRSMPTSRVSSPEIPGKSGGYGLWAICAGGIFVCYFFYGLLQEKM